jgi:hypothetical protein
MLCLIGLFIISGVIGCYISDKRQDENYKRERIETIKEEVRNGFKDIVSHACNFGDEYYTSLMDFASKMEKLTDVSVMPDLKPYDIYNIAHLRNGKIGNKIGKIVINKNLEPKFMVTVLSTIPSRTDIQLEAALCIKEVKELAKKCRDIRMNTEIDEFRKDKVKKAING